MCVSVELPVFLFELQMCREKAERPSYQQHADVLLFMQLVVTLQDRKKSSGLEKSVIKCERRTGAAWSHGQQRKTAK